MEGVFFVFLVMVAGLSLLSFVYAAEWDDFESNGSEGLEEDFLGDVEENNFNEEGPLEAATSGSAYSLNFYYALGAAVVAVGIVLFFAYALLKKPKDRWKTQR